MTRAFIALGSNINPEYNMREAVQRLAEPSARCRLLAVSPVYETAPVGKTDQPNFLNAAALIETDLTAAELKTQVLQIIERELGRVRTEDKNAPRTIDLDIALFDDQVLDVGSRHIPDPDISKYPHIAVPLADLAPQQLHPETGRTLLEIAQGLPVSGLMRRPDVVLWPKTPSKSGKERKND
jgi:2-amino-4-hydroxy-6-hydroxymethyldihydropteridine diphosphokinase